MPLQGEPPPDGGAALFALSFLAIPAFGCAALVLGTAVPHRASVVPWALVVFGCMSVGALWVYRSRTSATLLAKACVVGVLSLVAFLVDLKSSTSDIRGDDVMPLFFVIVGPLFVVGGGVMGMLSGGAALAAFAIRQRARVAWLRAVMSVGHERYGVVPLKPTDAGKPLFLRYRDADLALCSYRPPTDYREPVGAEIVARVPRLL